ncbi:MAG: hypothetical protein ACKO0W_03000, partial [Planctomycetota bacterium]
VGYDRAWGDVDVRLANLSLVEGRYDDAAARVRLEVDTVDNVALPSRGTYALVDLRRADEAFGADLAYTRSDALLQHTLPLGRFVVSPQARWTATWSGDLPLVRMPALGGFLNLTGLPRNSDPANNLAVGALAARYRLNTSALLLDIPLWLGGSYEAGATADRRGDVLDRLRQGGSAFVAADTPLGAVLVGGGLAESEGMTLFLFVGRAL